MQFTITTQTSRIAGAKVQDPVIRAGRRAIVLDGNAPRSLVKLIPHGWGNAPHQAWRPLVEKAIAMGAL